MKQSQILQQIANILLVNNQFTSEFGLISGKMGHCIFLYEYARYTNIQEYNKYAQYILDTILSQIYNLHSIDFQTGLTGIGWGINHLLAHKYIKEDPDEILELLDKKIEPLLAKSFSLPNKIYTSYVIPHFYLLHRYEVKQWNEKGAILQNLINAVNKSLDSHADLSSIYLNSIHSFFKSLNMYLQLPSISDKIDKIWKYKSSMTCTDLKELGVLSWQAVLYDKKIELKFTEKQIAQYISHIAQDIDPSDLTMDNIIGIGWGILHEVYKLKTPLL